VSHARAIFERLEQAHRQLPNLVVPEARERHRAQEQGLGLLIVPRVSTQLARPATTSSDCQLCPSVTSRSATAPSAA
jgi:hypothetical protein